MVRRMTGGALPPSKLFSRLTSEAGRARLSIATFGLFSFASGLGEAVLLYLIVQAGATLAEGSKGLDVDIGPLTLGHLDLGAAGLVALGVLLTLVVIAAVNSLLLARVSTRRLNRARKSALGAFLGARWEVQSVEPEGRLQEALTAWVSKAAVSTVAIGGMLSGFLGFLAMLATSFLLQPFAAAAVLGAGGLLYALLSPVRRLSRTASGRHLKITRHFAERVSELVSLASELRTFGAEAAALASAASRADAAERSGFRSRFLMAFSPYLYQYAALLLVILGVLVLGSLGDVDAAEVGAVILLLVRALSYTQRMTTNVQRLAENAPYLDELDRLEALYADHAVEPAGEPLPRVSELRLDHVHYAYEPPQPVLHDLCVTIDSGEAIGVVGPSGSGKSTLVQILLRLRAPTGGSYLVNGTRAEKYALFDWYDRFAFVPQENRLLRATVADNIRFFRSAEDDEVVRAAGRAHLHEEIEALPEGYATVVGAGARQLSGGQRQRLGLARALLGSPDVLLLDEPTSALDMRSEEIVQKTLGELKGQVTLIVIAHRMSTLTLCDRILVLEDGRVTGFGSQRNLAESNAFFSDAIRLSRLPA